MKNTIKVLGLSALVALSLNAGMAQADNGSCLLGSSSQSSASRGGNLDAGGPPMMGMMEARMNQQLDRIEQSLRNGQITPMQAGKMMREQWEVMQFQRGFLEGSRASGMGDMASRGSDSCGLKQDVKEVAAKLAPVMGSMAAEGMHTATTVMRALAREAEKLIREDEAMDQRF